jgi:hypothetical protein
MIEVVGCLIMGSCACALFLATVSLGVATRAPSRPPTEARPVAHAE